MDEREKGLVLPFVVIITVIFCIMGLTILTLAEQEIIQTRIENDKNKAFYFAEAGLGKLSEGLQKLSAGDFNDTIGESIGQGRYYVEIDTNHTPYYAVSTGVSGVVQKKIRVQMNFLGAPFENAIYAMNNSGSAWAFQLRGTGSPEPKGQGEQGGKDMVNGNVFIDGDAYLYEQSSVNAVPAPNRWDLHGDVDATGNITVLGSSHISGARTPNTEEPQQIDVRAMDYEHTNTYNVSQIFQSAGVGSGHLPSGDTLRDVFIKNPSDRSNETSTTPGDDYFIEPTAVSGGGDQRDARTPLHLGNNRIYYVDGDVWVHNLTTYGFKVDGKVTIVTTGNIHICDNIKYADSNSMLGLVALGKYDSSGNRISGGDIFFGDPRYGTTYTVSAMMFAANNFYYNTDSVNRLTAEPTTGFTVNGCFTAMNEVIVERDWYTEDGGPGTNARAARYDSSVGKWIDSETQTAISSTEVASLRHYQMIINYDERVRSPETQPPGLPRGNGRIFAGFSNWEEL